MALTGKQFVAGLVKTHPAGVSHRPYAVLLDKRYFQTSSGQASDRAQFFNAEGSTPIPQDVVDGQGNAIAPTAG